MGNLSQEVRFVMQDEAEASGCSHVNRERGILSAVTSYGRWPKCLHLWGCVSSHTETDGLWCLLTFHSDKCNLTTHLTIPIFNHCQKNLKITERVRLGGITVSHLVQPLCSRRIIPQHTAQDCVQMVLEYLHQGRLHNLWAICPSAWSPTQ